MPRVSILMPTHNRAEVVGHAIESALAQTMADFELLAVLDGCTDGTLGVVEAYGDSRIRIFDLPKSPHFGYANRNVALREARGEFIAFLGHDNLLFPDHLERLTALLDHADIEWGYSRPLWVSTDGIIVPFATNLTLPDELDTFMSGLNTVPATCILYRRRCLARDGYVPEHMASSADWGHWVAIINGGGRQNVAYDSTPTCLHFSADWRRSRSAGNDLVATLLRMADTAPWWPQALRRQIPAGTLEQAVFARALREDGHDWIQDIRHGVTFALDRIAWDAVRRPSLIRRFFRRIPARYRRPGRRSH